MQFDIYSGNQGGQRLARGLGLCKIIHNHFKNTFYKNVQAEICEILRICAALNPNLQVVLAYAWHV